LAFRVFGRDFFVILPRNRSVRSVPFAGLAANNPWPVSWDRHGTSAGHRSGGRVCGTRYVCDPENLVPARRWLRRLSDEWHKRRAHAGRRKRTSV